MVMGLLTQSVNKPITIYRLTIGARFIAHKAIYRMNTE